MRAPALCVLAAGMGSRYGGLKQIDPMGPNGEIIIDYSLYDAYEAGFRDVVFIIKEELFETFREVVGNRAEKKFNVDYVFQRISDIPEPFRLPEGREKPWGTTHAVLSCRGVLHDRPFAVINADDFYGRNAYKVIFDYLKDCERRGPMELAMVGYTLNNTLTAHGLVARGVCSVGRGEMLTAVTERKKIGFKDGRVQYTEDGERFFELDPESTVSLNFWGLTPGVFEHFAKDFQAFFKNGGGQSQKSECLLPESVNSLVVNRLGSVRVLRSNDPWYGVTYRQDRDVVKEIFERFHAEGQYPGLV